MKVRRQQNGLALRLDLELDNDISVERYQIDLTDFEIIVEDVTGYRIQGGDVDVTVDEVAATASGDAYLGSATYQKTTDEADVTKLLYLGSSSGPRGLRGPERPGGRCSRWTGGGPCRCSPAGSRCRPDCRCSCPR